MGGSNLRIYPSENARAYMNIRAQPPPVLAIRVRSLPLSGVLVACGSCHILGRKRMRTYILPHPWTFWPSGFSVQTRSVISPWALSGSDAVAFVAVAFGR